MFELSSIKKQITRHGVRAGEDTGGFGGIAGMLSDRVLALVNGENRPAVVLSVHKLPRVFASDTVLQPCEHLPLAHIADPGGDSPEHSQIFTRTCGSLVAHQFS